jgi:RNA polymerase sigma factor for flagellar operon FliA
MNNNLIIEHLKFANILAGRTKSKTRYVSYEELQSAAYLGLVEAANKYCSDCNVPFRSFAFIRINGAMKDYLRELRWGSRRKPIFMDNLDS